MAETFLKGLIGAGAKVPYHIKQIMQMVDIYGKTEVLRSEKAIQVNVEIMRAFVRMKGITKILDMKRKYDKKFKSIFEAIAYLMTKDEETEEEEDIPKKQIGFKTDKDE